MSGLPALLWRGFRRRCPVCATKTAKLGPVRIAPRCARCNFPIEDRIEGHMVGSVGVNTIVTFGLLAVALMVAVALTYPHLPAGPLTAVLMAVAVIFPVAFHTRSRTVWSAIDLAMRPLDPSDEVDAPG